MHPGADAHAKLGAWVSEAGGAAASDSHQRSPDARCRLNLGQAAALAGSLMITITQLQNAGIFHRDLK